MSFEESIERNDPTDFHTYYASNIASDELSQDGGDYEGGAQKNGIKLKPHQINVGHLLRKHDTKGLLVFHGLGSGKTMTGLAVAKEFSDKKIVIVAPAAVKRRFEDDLNKLGMDSKRFSIYSYESFRPVFEKDNKILKNKILIVDEAHRLRNYGHIGEQGEAIGGMFSRSVLLAAQYAYKVVFMTATPVINHPSDIAPLINILALNENKMLLPAKRHLFEKEFGTVTKAKELGKKISKYVSHYTPEDKSDFPRLSEHLELVSMSPEQRKAYLDAETKTLKMKNLYNLMKEVDLSAIDKPRKENEILLNRFLNVTRQVSNTVRSDSSTPKISGIVKHIKNGPGPAVVYSNFMENGLTPVAERLKKEGLKVEIFHGDVSPVQRKKIVDRYNNGETDVLLISSAAAEGVDLHKTRQIHVMEPHWNDPKIRQVIGRTARYKSHAELPISQRKVDVYRWISTIPHATQFAKQVDEKNKRNKSKKKEKRSRSKSRSDRAKSKKSVENISGIKAAMSADEYLLEMSNRKKKYNARYINTLKIVHMKCEKQIRNVMQLSLEK
jgi:superfamily II DNA or RNA helicase